MRISVAQLNYRIGDFSGNVEKCLRAIEEARKSNADLVLFSELSVTGYPPHDLLESEDFIKACEKSIEQIALATSGIAIVIGAPSINSGKSGKRLFNSAYFIQDGAVRDIIHKSLLPTYDIFDEYRYFEPANKFKIIDFKGKKLAVTICEDLWDEQDFDNEFSSSRLYSVSPMDELAKLNPDIILNLSASPFSSTRVEMKRKVFTNKAAKHQLPLFMANQTGGNSELIFDGGSMVISPSGQIFDTLGSFTETIRTYDLEEVTQYSAVTEETEVETIAMIHDALVFGISDFFLKMGFKSAIVGLSGGIDSAIVLTLAARALGSENVQALLMPSMYSSDHSINDAVALANNLNTAYSIINIENSYNAVIESLNPLFSGTTEDVTEENIQARIRAVLLMAASNKFGSILLNTSNKSEAAVGYGTLYGDMTGSLSVLGDVYKTDVYKLARYINRDSEIIPENSIIKPPSAELKPDQRDSDSLPEYDVLDSILYQYIELQRPIGKIHCDGIDNDLIIKVIDLINRNEYKRFQAPPILRISSKSFGIGRRLPLVAKY